MANDIVIGVTADSSKVASGLAPGIKALSTMGTTAQKTEAELEALAATKVAPTITVNVKDQAIAKAKADIARLRDEVARGLLIGADTKPAEREIARLQTSLRRLEGQRVRVPVEVTGADQAKGSLGDLSDLLGQVNLGALGAVRSMGPLGLVSAAGALGVQTTKLAANMQSLRLSMKAVVRDGGDVNEILSDLRDFGARSDFEFPELATAARTLIAFGVASKDSVTTLKNLGEAASALQIPIEDVARIYGQMFAKGTVQQEQAMQLIERGIPLWEAFAKATGKSVTEVKAMADAGKLGRAEISKLDEALAGMFAGSTQAQADTLNGKLSTLNDNIKTIAVSIGDELLPAAEDAVDVLNELLASDFGGSLAKSLVSSPVLGWYRDLIHANEDAKLAAKKHAEETDALADAQRNAIDPTAAMLDQYRNLNDQYEAAGSKVDKLVESLGILNQGMLDVDDAWAAYEEQVDSANEALKENGATVDRHTEKGRENRDVIKDTARRIAELAQARLKDMDKSGESRDKILADYAKQREGLIKTADKLGMTKDEATKYVDKLLEAPEDVTTDIQLNGLKEAEDDLAELTRTRTVWIDLFLRNQLPGYYAGQAPIQGPPNKPSGNAAQGQAFAAGLNAWSPSTVVTRRPVLDEDGLPRTGPGRMVEEMVTTRNVTALNSIPGMPTAVASSAAGTQVFVIVSDRKMADLIDVQVRDAVTGSVQTLASRRVVQV